MYHPQLHLEIPKVPFAWIAIDTIGKLPTTSSGHRHALTCINLFTSYVKTMPMVDKTAKFSCRSLFIWYTVQSRSFYGIVFHTMALNSKFIQMIIVCNSARHQTHIFQPFIRPQGTHWHWTHAHFHKKNIDIAIYPVSYAIWIYIVYTTMPIYYIYKLQLNRHQLSRWLRKSIFPKVHGRYDFKDTLEMLNPGNIRYMGNNKGLITVYSKLCKL